MILHSIRLHPFAGIKDQTFSFVEGINIIYGPNEFGKSTVVNAIHFVLFESTNTTPKKLSELTKRFKPINGGDTICITLKFGWDHHLFTLEKQWGSTCYSKLTRSDGVIYTDADTIHQQIMSMLPANEAIVRQILIANQTELADAVNNMSMDARTSLSEKLRGAILYGGGINGTLLKNTIDEKVNNYYKRWDSKNNLPEGGASRGVQNPWMKDKGYILDAWYELEKTKITEKETVFFENENDRIQISIQEINKRLKTTNDFLLVNEKIYADSNQRMKLNTEIEKFQHALSSFAEEALRWPQLISDKESKTKYLNTVNEELQNIRTELQYVEQKRAASKDMEKQRQVTLLNEEITAAEEKLKKLPTVTDKEITEINQLQKEALRSQALIDGQKLLLKIHPSVSGSIEVIQSRDQKEKIEFESGNSKIIHINGLAEWEWNDIIFTVQSANEDIETLNCQLEKIQETINTFLNTYNQTSIEDLIIITETRKKFDSIIEEKKANLKQLLGDDTLESLSERCKHTKNFPDTRDYQTIQKLKEDKIKESSVLQTELAKIEEELLTLEKKHISLSNLDQRRVKGLFEIKQKEDNLKLLSPLPHQYESEEAFNLIYKKFEEEKKGLVNQKHILELELKDLKQPILSLQEAAEQKVIADNKFQRLLKEGNAYIRIQEVLNQIINEADGNAFMPLHKRTEYYLNKLSNGRFQEIPFDATQPQELKGSDIKLPVTLLSKGTKDLLALAFRLAAADIFLENGTGFIVMDDPLVDMDLQRREAASEVLRTFALKQQTILFTCHQ